MVVTVRAGKAVWGGEDVSLPEDKSYVVSEDQSSRTIMGYLVRDTASGEATVLVDEVATDDAPFQFTGSAYTPICQLFSIELPGGAASIEDASARVYRVLPVKMAPRGGV